MNYPFLNDSEQGKIIYIKCMQKINHIPNIEESFGQVLATTIDASSVAVSMKMVTGYKMSGYCVCYLVDSKDTRHRLMSKIRAVSLKLSRHLAVRYLQKENAPQIQDAQVYTLRTCDELVYSVYIAGFF